MRTKFDDLRIYLYSYALESTMVISYLLDKVVNSGEKDFSIYLSGS